MNGDYMTISEMMEICGKRSRKRFRENYVTPALEDGPIERKYPEQPYHPKQQYRLTEKALEWKKLKEREGN
jgi:ATP-dependent DNA helicase RecG